MATDPYEGVVRDDFAESLRLPLVTSPYPRWHFITAVVVGEDLWQAVRPTDDELRVVASFHDEYVAYWYQESGFKKLMMERPFDVDGGANGRILMKRADGDWAFRRRSWVGMEFVPAWNAEPQSLTWVLDKMHNIVDKLTDHWVQWKTDHPDLFPAVKS